jgi:hydroxymethylpyrimidine/phosphomethylpyrimidine kinase
MSALTAITAQNTTAVTAVQDILPEIVKAQIDAVADDIGVDAAKTGMLHTIEIIKAVSEEIEKYRFPVVVDPVMIAKSGAPLLKPEATSTLIKRLLPLATVVTPNAMEAEAISGLKIKTLEEAKEAAKRISNLGPKAVVVKGGHILSGERAIDVLYMEGEFRSYEAERFDTKTTHGTGCCFSAAIAAELAKGKSIIEAVEVAKEFVSKAVKFGLEVGRGFGPVNPMANLYMEAEKYAIIKNVKEAVKILEANAEIANLIPEVQSNIAMASSYASSYADVASIPGRIVKVEGGVKASGCPEFGVSRHVAKTVLAVMKHNPSIRAGLNIKYSDEIVKICESLGLTASYYDRREEPKEIKEREGMTVIWGAEQAIKKIGKVPNVIYHFGDWGKEPMITILGRTAVEVAETAVKVAREHAKRKASA